MPRHHRNVRQVRFPCQRLPAGTSKRRRRHDRPYDPLTTTSRTTELKVKSRLLAGTAAVALALVGALLIIFYANGADQRALATTEPVDVLVVKTAIPAGTPVNDMAASLVIEKVP